MNDTSAFKISRGAFLKDVLIASLGAYGGPEAHMGVFSDQLVHKKGYLTEEELVELIALCSILPGPTSTQTIVAIGYKTGGPMLAFLTMMVWAMPVLVVMTLLSFMYQFLEGRSISTEILRYIGPMAVGFIILAAYRISRKVVSRNYTMLLMLFGAVTTYFFRMAWVFPLVLVLGGVVSILLSEEKNLWNRVRVDPPWGYLFAFLFLALGGIAGTLLWGNRILVLFEKFYRYGYLVFGGGQVVVPLMYNELVHVDRFMTSAEFLSGYGLVQGLPGPMFSFSAYAGGMASRGAGVFHQIGGAMAGGIGIFLPGLLLIYFIYPIWEKLKEIQGIRVALKGINAVAGGLIAAAALILMRQSGLQWDNLLVTGLTLGLLWSKKVPAPLVVLMALAAGALF